MLVLKYLLLFLGAGFFTSAVAVVLYDIYLASQLRRLLGRSAPGEGAAETSMSASASNLLLTERPLRPVRWGLAQRLAICGGVPLLLSRSIVLVPHGPAALLIRQISPPPPHPLHTA